MNRAVAITDKSIHPHGFRQFLIIPILFIYITVITEIGRFIRSKRAHDYRSHFGSGQIIPGIQLLIFIAL